MSFIIDIRSDINKIARHMDDFERKQIPFAISLTLNRLSVFSQEYICKRIPVIFNNSRKWWDKHQRTGIKVAFSDKYNLVTSVYTKAPFAHIQEEGGTKRPYRSSMIAVPTSNIPRKQRSSKALRLERGNRAVFRLGKSIYKRISNRQLQKLYSLTPEARIKARFGFKKMVIDVFNKQFDRIFTKSFNFALDTAR